MTKTVSAAGVGTVFVMCGPIGPVACDGVRVGREAPGARGPYRGPHRPDGPRAQEAALS